MSALEEAIGLGVTIALIDQFSEGAEHVIGKFEEMERAAGHSTHAIKEAIEDMKLGRDFLEAGAAIAGPIIAAGVHAVETAVHLGELRESVNALAGDSGQLARELKGISEDAGLFNEEKMLNTAKNLQAMGIAADRIPGIMKASSQAAAVLGRDLGSVAQTFQRVDFMAQTGMPVSVRLFRSLGITAGDLVAQGLSVTKGRIKNSAEEIMTAAQNVIQQRFGERAEEMAHGVEALHVQIAQAITDGWEAAGHEVEPIQKGIMQGMLEILRDGAPAFGAQFGAGIKLAYTWLEPVGHLLKEAAVWLVAFVKEHPNIIRVATALALITGLVLAGAGALLVFKGAVMLLPIAFKFFAAQAIESLTAVTLAVPGLLVFSLVAAALYQAWNENFGGMQSTLTSWYQSARDIATALYYLFTTGDGSVAAIPAELHDRLMTNGLWPLLMEIWKWGTRVVEFFKGVWAGIKVVASDMGHAFSGVWTAIKKVWDVLGDLAALLDFSGGEMGKTADTTKEAANTFQLAGHMVAQLVEGLIAYKAATMALSVIQTVIALVKGFTAATAAAETAQWGLNLAMLANPVGIIMLAFVLLGAAIVLTLAQLKDFLDTWTATTNSPEFRAAAKVVPALSMFTSGSDEDAARLRQSALGNMAGRHQALKDEYGDDGLGAEVKSLFGISGKDRASAMIPAQAAAAEPSAKSEGGEKYKTLKIVTQMLVDKKVLHESTRDVELDERDRDEGGD